MPNKLTSVFALALTAALTLAACSPSPSAAPPAPTPTPTLTPSTAPAELEATGFCRPRQCGPVPICTADSVATCTPDTGCRWKCVPLISPI